MKIAIIGSAHPLRGGLAAFNERLAVALQQQGHELVIYSFSLQYPNFLFPGSTQFTDEPKPPQLDIRTSINSINPFNWIKVGAKIRRGRFDLIIVKYWLPFMGPAFGTILRRAKRNSPTKVICIVDNIVPHEKRFGDTVFTKYFIQPVDAFLTMSKEVLKDVRTFTNKPSFFTAHPVYDVYKDGVTKVEGCRYLGLDSGLRYILFFGFIRRYKGLDLLLEAMADERIRAACIHLIVAGEYYDDKSFYESLIFRYGLQRVVHQFTTFIPNNDVRFYFSAADVVVQPYRHATQSGITQIAYHFEKPMIVTDVGGLAEVVPNGKVGFVVSPDARSVASAILDFYAPDALPDVDIYLKAEKAKYSWAEFVRVLLNSIK